MVHADLKLLTDFVHDDHDQLLSPGNSLEQEVTLMPRGRTNLRSVFHKDESVLQRLPFPIEHAAPDSPPDSNSRAYRVVGHPVERDESYLYQNKMNRYHADRAARSGDRTRRSGNRHVLLANLLDPIADARQLPCRGGRNVRGTSLLFGCHCCLLTGW